MTRDTSPSGALDTDDSGTNPLGLDSCRLSRTTPNLRETTNPAPYPVGALSWLQDQFGLTNREIEVVTHIMMAKSSKQIAHALNICTPTVDIHRARIRRKLGVHNTAGVFQVLFQGQAAKDLNNNNELKH